MNELPLSRVEIATYKLSFVTDKCKIFAGSLGKKCRASIFSQDHLTNTFSAPPL